LEQLERLRKLGAGLEVWRCKNEAEHGAIFDLEGTKSVKGSEQW
jgi:hypothetical protein